MKLFRLLIAATLFTMMFSFLSIPVRAAAANGDVGLVTKGDVTKILNVWGRGGGVFNHIQLAGFNDYPRAAITPLPSHDGAHFCVDDWHVVRASLGESVDYSSTFTKKQVLADLQSYTITLSLDGVTLPGTRKPITMLNTADQKSMGFPGPLFYFQTGSILAPGDISVGDHTAGVLYSSTIYGDDFHTSTFTVDASGTGVCLQP
jgi:hypothetical protein